MKKSTCLPFLMAGLLAAAGAQAQTSSASGSSDAPLKAGEVSTQTQGQPNAKTTNSPVGDTAAPAPMSHDATQSMGAAAGTSAVPSKPGEASTYVQGKPNADPMAPHALTRAEVIGELMNRGDWYRAQKGIGLHRAKSPA